MLALTKWIFREYETGTFKLIEGKNGLTAFLPLNANIGGEIRPDKYLTEEQTRHVYKRWNQVT